MSLEQPVVAFDKPQTKGFFPFIWSEVALMQLCAVLAHAVIRHQGAETGASLLRTWQSSKLASWPSFLQVR